LPNGWEYSISYTLFTDQNGFCWEGIGVPPDLRIINTQEDIAQKNDKVLEFAMELIHSGGKL
jgi:C-terminal processing protease CtpA/Prc